MCSVFRGFNFRGLKESRKIEPREKNLFYGMVMDMLMDMPMDMVLHLVMDMVFDMVMGLVMDMVMGLVLDMVMGLVMDIAIVTAVISDEFSVVMTAKWLRFATKSCSNTLS